MKDYTKEDIERLIGLIIRQVQQDKKIEISPDKKLFEDLGLDSIQFVSVLVELEVQFEFQFDNETFGKLYDMTISQIVDYIFSIRKGKQDA